MIDDIILIKLIFFLDGQSVEMSMDFNWILIYDLGSVIINLGLIKNRSIRRYYEIFQYFCYTWFYKKEQNFKNMIFIIYLSKV